MPTDDERREVARRLREIADRHDGVAATIVERRLGLESDERFLAGSVFTSKSVGRLADLIEPSDTTSRQCRDSVACDREALLALAQELSMEGMDGWLVSPAQYARRIRKALGVE